eukprot:gene2456-5390_t
MQTCRRADMQTCRRADVQTCRRADMQTCRRADVQMGWPTTQEDDMQTWCGRSQQSHIHHNTFSELPRGGTPQEVVVADDVEVEFSCSGDSTGKMFRGLVLAVFLHLRHSAQFYVVFKDASAGHSEGGDGGGTCNFDKSYIDLAFDISFHHTFTPDQRNLLEQDNTTALSSQSLNPFAFERNRSRLRKGKLKGDTSAISLHSPTPFSILAPIKKRKRHRTDICSGKHVYADLYIPTITSISADPRLADVCLSELPLKQHSTHLCSELKQPDHHHPLEVHPLRSKHCKFDGSIFLS